MRFWNNFVKLFSRADQPGSEPARKQSIESPPPAPVTPSSPTSTPPTTPPPAPDQSVDSGPSDIDSPPTPASNNTGNTKPRSKPRRRKKNSVPDKTIQQLKEKYRPDASPERSSSSPSSSSSSSSSSSPPPSVDGEAKVRRPKKKHKMSSSRSHTRRSGSLRKAVLMQEEAKFVMTLDDVRSADDEGNTPLHRVALLGNYEAVSILCKRAPDIINRLNKNGMSALHYASNSNCVNVLIWWGAAIDSKSSSGKTPLYCAVERGTSPDAVEALLQRGAKVNQKDKDQGWVPLHVAAMRGLVQIVELLLEWNADVNARDRRHATPLHMCAGAKSRESEEVCRRLLNKHAPVSPRDLNGTTPLHLACGAGNTAVLALILDKMGRFFPDALDLVDYKGCTAYHYAAMGGHTECIEVLKRELPVCEPWLDDNGLSYPSWALLKGHFMPEFFPSGMVPFCTDFTSCVNEESTSDIVFLVEGLPVFAHKILCYVSPHLAKLIDVVSASELAANSSSPHRGSHPANPAFKPTIDLKGIVSHKLFVEILQFMYTSKIPKDADWTQLWFAAIKLELLRLQQLCEKELGSNPIRERSLSAGSKRNSPNSPSTTTSTVSDTTPNTPNTPNIPNTSNTGNALNASTASASNSANDYPSPSDLSNTLVNSTDSEPSTTSTTNDINNTNHNGTNDNSNDTKTEVNNAGSNARNENTTNDDLINTTTSTSSDNTTNASKSANSDTTDNAINSSGPATSSTTSDPVINTFNTPAISAFTTSDTSPTSTHTPAALRRRTTSRKRSNSSASRMQMGVDPQIDYILGLSLSLRRFVGNPMFHDVLFICAEENVYAHKVIIRKRSPNFFFILAKNALSESANNSSTELVFHFDDITKGAMMSLMEYIYCGGFHSKIEAEDAWVMYNFVVKHGINCPGLKERACYLFYNALSPENLLDIVALNRYGFTINTLPYSTADSARYSARDKEGSASDPTHTVSRNSMGSISPTTTTTTTITTTTNPPSPTNSPNLIPNTYVPPSNTSNVLGDNYRASLTLPNSINRNSTNRNSISINRLPNPSTPSPHTTNQEILLTLLKYASKKPVIKYITKHNKKHPTLKLLQTELRKYKAEPEADTSRLWKDRQKEVKAFAKRKKLQFADSLPKQQLSEASIGRRN